MMMLLLTPTTRWTPWIALMLVLGRAESGLAQATPARPEAPALKTFELGDFPLENGKVLKAARLAYTTRGTLNAARTNAILLPSPYSGDHTSHDFLIGPGRPIDPAVHFLIATNQLGNGKSSSPSNTAGDQHGADFPALAIRDDVQATHRLVAQEFGIEKLLAVVGFSMGGQQAMQWAVSYPDAMRGVVNLCGSAREYPFGYVRLEGAKGAIMGDPTWAGGRYTEPPVGGLRALGLHWIAWAYSPEWWRDGEYKARGGSIDRQVERWKSAFLSSDANDLLCQAVKWQNNDVANTPGAGGDLARALGSIKAKVLLMPSRSDQYFRAADVEAEGKLIPGSRLFVIPSTYGHTAGGGGDPAMRPILDRAIKEFLDSLDEPAAPGR